MSKRYSIFLTALFCAFLGVFAVLHWAVPDREFSENENRYLGQMPTPDFTLPSFLDDTTGGNIFSGEFMSDFEDYYTDQFPLRDAFISMKAACETALGKTENNDVFYGEDNTLFAQLNQPDESHQPDTLVGYVDALAGNLDVPVWFSLVPDKLNIMGDRLLDPPLLAPFHSGSPLALALNYSGADLWERAAQTQANWVDLMSVFQAHADEDLYYRTDHHWTSLGAYYAYATLMEAMGIDPVPLSDYTATTVSDSFLGTTWSSVGAGWIQPDSIQTYVPDEGVKVVTYPEGSPVEGTLYVEEKLDTKDKYAYFLGGNTPLAVLTTEHTDAPKVLIIRDSYSDSMAPFLTAHFSEIHLFDLRYNNMNLPQYVADNDIDAVVVLYSLSNFTTDTNLFKLAIG